MKSAGLGWLILAIIVSGGVTPIFPPAAVAGFLLVGVVVFALLFGGKDQEEGEGPADKRGELEQPAGPPNENTSKEMEVPCRWG